MIGLKRRKRVEGWTVNVSDFGNEAENSSLRQRLADNSKLWILSLVAIVLITGFLVHKTRQGAPAPDDNYASKLQSSADSSYFDKAHQQFVSDFKTSKAYGFTVKEASFLDSGLLQVVVPGDISADDVEYMANMAGMKALHSLKERIVVNVYYKAISSSPDAVASYDPKKNAFSVKFKSTGVAPTES